MIYKSAVLLICFYGMCLTAEMREKRSVNDDDGYGGGYDDSKEFGYESKHYYKAKSCYQCAYSPPKTYYGRKVKVESHVYDKPYEQVSESGYGEDDGYHGEKHGGYVEKSYIPVPYTINGGWDKCLGPFDNDQAQSFGIDVWDCDSNCYIRKDSNGNIFRGCYKGEYGVDPYKIGCHYQAGSQYCFCEGDNCNNGAVH